MAECNEHNEIKKRRIQQIQELQEIMGYNEKEHSKFSSSYKNYVNKKGEYVYEHYK